MEPETATDALVVVGTDTVVARGVRLPVAAVVVGGLTILQRALRSAQLAGCPRIFVVTPDADAVRRLAASDPVVTVPVHPIERDGPTDSVAAVLHELRGRLPERVVAAPADRVLTPASFQRAVAVAPSAPLETLEAAVRRPSGLGPVILTPADLREAGSALLRSLRKPLARHADGPTAFYLNRPVSLALSRWLVGTPVTPNHVTTVALLLGLAAAACAATAEWGLLIVGGLLLQLSSILDGVDGEIARMRLTASRAGEWYDTICDDVINTAFMIALGVAAVRRTGEPLWAWATVAAAITAVVLASLLYRELARHGIASHNHLRWGFEEGGRSAALARVARPVLVAFSYIAKRDTYTLVVLALLVLDRPVAAFVFMAVGNAAVLVGFAVRRPSVAPDALREGIAPPAHPTQKAVPEGDGRM